MTTKITYNSTPDPDNWFIKMWLEKAKGEMIDTLAVYGNVYTKIEEGGLEITGVWIDESSSLSDVQVKYLNDKHLKLKAFDAPKKQQKPKHKIPYWAVDYRRKK